MYLSFYCKVWKGYSRFYGERELETEQNCNILTPTLMAVSVVSFSFSRAAQPEAQGPSSLLDDGFLYCILSPTGLQNSIGGPEGRFDRVWLSLPHLVSDVSDPQLIRGSKGPLCRVFSTTSYQQLLWIPTQSGALRAPLAWCGFPYHISSLTPNLWLLVLTELYNSSMPTQSPTQSLEWHVWSSSSGNNCHAVQRSLSSGVSVYECTMGFITLSHFVSQARLRDFLS